MFMGNMWRCGDAQKRLWKSLKKFEDIWKSLKVLDGDYRESVGLRD
jgi:hypothetical protein